MGLCSLFLLRFFSLLVTSGTTASSPGANDLSAYLSARDSVDLWITQWDACYDPVTYEFECAISIYGGGMLITPDSIYTFTASSGFYSRGVNNLTAPGAVFSEDRLCVYKNTSSDCPIDGDNCAHAVISLYQRQSVPSTMVREVWLDGADYRGRAKNELFGIALSSWVSLDPPSTYTAVE